MQNSNIAGAESAQDKINRLNKEIQQYQDAANSKHEEANTLKGAIAEIDSEIAVAQKALDLTSSQIADNNDQIDKANQELDRQKSILKDNLKIIYKQGEVSPIEIIASSKNLSDFVSQQEYYSAIKDKIDQNLKKIDELKKELDSKKSQLTGLSTQQKATYDKIAAQRAEQSSLLARTQGDEANYRKIASEDNAKIGELRRQQAAIIASYSSNVRYGGSGGYPWAGAGFPCSGIDPWGMCYRQCVSYTAWKVASTGRNMPYWGGRGNANQWDDNARAAGIPVDGVPRVGDVAISNAGEFGHAMYVESVNGNTVHVSQYNANWNGTYSTSDVPIAGLVFIHF